MEGFTQIVITWRSALIFAVCLPILMIAIALFFKKTEAKASLWLGLFLVFTIISIIPQIIGFSGFYDIWPQLTFAPFNTEFYLGPLMYLHAHSLMKNSIFGKLKWLLLPGLIQTSFYLWAFLFIGSVENKWAFNSAIYQPYIQPIETVISILLVLLAFIKIAQMIKEYYQYIENSQSSAKEFEPVWLKRFLLVFFIAGVLFFLMKLLPLFIGSISYIEEYPIILLIMVSLLWLAFEALVRLNVSFPKMDKQPSIKSEEDKDWLKESILLNQKILNEKWYLEPRLSLRQLAQRLASNESYISRTINKGLGKSFNAYINQFRVDYAKDLINQNETSMLIIALDSGFNSKATFNRVFKEHSGLTPTQFKKSQLQ
jgi:AraC-like DNA-binding protein